MNTTPFLAKFARPLPDSNNEINNSVSSVQNGKEKSQNQPPGTFFTKVDRETTDDR